MEAGRMWRRSRAWPGMHQPDAGCKPDTSPGQQTRGLVRSCCSVAVGTGLGLRLQSLRAHWDSQKHIGSRLAKHAHCGAARGTAGVGWQEVPPLICRMPPQWQRHCHSCHSIGYHSQRPNAHPACTCRRPVSGHLTLQAVRPMLVCVLAGQGPAGGLLSCHAAEIVF